MASISMIQIQSDCVVLLKLAADGWILVFISIIYMDVHPGT